MKNRIDEKWIGDLFIPGGARNRVEHCTVIKGEKTTYYCIMLPNDICDWMRHQNHNGLALGFGMALALRLTWDEICKLTFERLLLCTADGIWISHIECINGVDHYSGRMVHAGRMFKTWMLARVAYLCTLGYDIDDIYRLPAASKVDDPTKAATARDLEKYAREVLPVFYGENDAEKHGITVEEGAVV